MHFTLCLLHNSVTAASRTTPGLSVTGGGLMAAIRMPEICLCFVSPVKVCLTRDFIHINQYTTLYFLGSAMELLSLGRCGSKCIVDSFDK